MPKSLLTDSARWLICYRLGGGPRSKGTIKNQQTASAVISLKDDKRYSSLSFAEKRDPTGKLQKSLSIPLKPASWEQRGIMCKTDSQWKYKRCQFQQTKGISLMQSISDALKVLMSTLRRAPTLSAHRLLSLSVPNAPTTLWKIMFQFVLSCRWLLKGH